MTYLLTYAHRPSWGIGRRQQIARVPCPGPSSLTGSRCSPSSWCLPGGPVATCFLVVLFSVCLEDSMSALAWWCLLLVFGASGQSRPIFFFWFPLRQVVVVSFPTIHCCWWCLASGSGGFFSGSCWQRSALCWWWCWLSSMSLLHTTRPSSRWSWTTGSLCVMTVPWSSRCSSVAGMPLLPCLSLLWRLRLCRPACWWHCRGMWRSLPPPVHFPPVWLGQCWLHSSWGPWSFLCGCSGPLVRRQLPVLSSCPASVDGCETAVPSHRRSPGLQVASIVSTGSHLSSVLWSSS